MPSERSHVKMMGRLNFLLVLVYILDHAMLEEIDVEEDGFCHRSGDSVNCVNDENLRLTRLESGQVGDIKEFTTSDGRSMKLSTVCVKPVLFEIDDFLTDKECEHFIQVAKQTGLKSSQTYSDEASLENGIKLMDVNHDMSLTLQEMRLTIQNSFDIYPDDEDLIEMNCLNTRRQHFRLAQIERNCRQQSNISQSELSKIRPYQLTEYLTDFVKNNPSKHSRYSTQAWLFPDSSTDEVFSAVQQRVADTVNLPLDLIKLSDFQVVKYGVHGHYNAHHDSSTTNTKVPCCDRNLKTPQKKCRICRYMTILFYLSDVTKGGETAFPVANNETIDQTILHMENIGHLFKKCETANLRISAKKRKAVIWYNHFIDEETGWMGDMDEYTFHGGCPVFEGEKWIANFWIKTDIYKHKDIKKMRKIRKISNKYTK